ncbi:MAG: hypothetical protein KDK51_06355 [Deltaproteobacteria bacterium]|nr:hypothetical protein [Deltaproteobacteria bacterium]
MHEVEKKLQNKIHIHPPQGLGIHLSYAVQRSIDAKSRRAHRYGYQLAWALLVLIVFMAGSWTGLQIHLVDTQETVFLTSEWVVE